jgi:hypothetical protein
MLTPSYPNPAAQRHRSITRPAVLLLAILALGFSSQGRALDRPPGFEDDLVWRVALAYEEYRPTVAGETRELVHRYAELRLEEPLGWGLYGGLRGGLATTRWELGAEGEVARHPGHLLGMQLGGRHPLGRTLQLNWELAYTWHSITGDVDEDSLRVSWFESFARAGLAVPLGPLSLEAGAEWREFDGEERLLNGARRERTLRLRDDRRPYIALGVALAAGGGVALRVAGDGDERNVTLIFSRQFYW